MAMAALVGQAFLTGADVLPELVEGVGEERKFDERAHRHRDKELRSEDAHWAQGMQHQDALHQWKHRHKVKRHKPDD